MVLSGILEFDSNLHSINENNNIINTCQTLKNNFVLRIGWNITMIDGSLYQEMRIQFSQNWVFMSHGNTKLALTIFCLKDDLANGYLLT